METYSNLILSIEDDENPNPLWLKFYQIQMASFILENYQFNLCLKNAIKAYHHIAEKWNELEEDFDEDEISVVNYDNLFRHISVDFSD